MHSHRSSFTFLKPHVFPLFSFSLVSPLLHPGEFYYHPLYLSKFLCSASQATFSFTATFAMDLSGTWWEAGGTWHQVGWLCVYLLSCLIKSAVWRRVATEWPCLWSERVNGGGSTLLPSHPHSPYPDKGKPLTGSDGARHLWGLPLLCSFHSSLSPFPLFTLWLCLPCPLASVFGGELHKSWTAFPPGRRKILIEKEIRNENSHSYSGLCYVKARKCTRGKKRKCTGESEKEIGHVLKTKWKKWSLTSRLSPLYL